MTISRKTLIIILLAFSSPCLAQVYSYIDERGNRTYTDSPRSETDQPIQLKPERTLEETALLMPVEKETQKPSALSSRYNSLHIISPSSDQSIREDAGNISVTVASEPRLRTGHMYQVLLDGKSTGARSSTPVIQLSNIDRGTHQLGVQIVDNAGTVIASSSELTFHLRRTTLADRKRTNPCKLRDYGVRLECPLSEKPKPEAKPMPVITPIANLLRRITTGR